MSHDAKATRSFLRTSLMLFVCTNASSVFQFVFQSLMRRELPTGDFSLMNSAFGTASLTALPVAIWGQVWVRKFSEMRARGQVGLAFASVRRFSAYALLLALAVVGLALGAAPALGAFLNTTNTAAVIALAFLLGASVAFPMTGVVFQGMQLFGVMSLVAILGPIVRLTLGLVLIHHGLGAASGIWATSTAALVPAVVAARLILSRGWFSLPPESGTATTGWRLPDLWVPAAGVAITTILVNTDFVLVQRFFAKPDADRFATAAIFGHSMIFFLMPIASVLLPKVVDHFEGWEKSERSVARKALALGLGLALTMALAGTALAPLAFNIFAGESDPETVALIRWFLWAIIPTALACIGISALVGRLQQRLILACLMVSLALPALIIWRHETVGQILGAHLAVGVALLAVIVGGNLPRRRSEHRA
ncbi:MAG: hypothetical protein IT577_02980 [Verrucomicrobiae bacterium]|nr:hypothetical protein [Verrucomicrobiae bacterium]